MASQDPECKLVNVGSWYSMTGYALAFPRNSRYYDKFNMKMLDYRKNGKLRYSVNLHNDLLRIDLFEKTFYHIQNRRVG